MIDYTCLSIRLIQGEYINKVVYICRFGNNGCDGGEDFRAYQWMLKHGGIPTEEDYGPYLGQV